MIDVISPCVTFNDHEGSTKSYAYAKDHDEPLGEVSFVPYFDDIAIDYEPGTTHGSEMHDGSKLYLKKVAEDYDPTDKMNAVRLHSRDRGTRRVRHRHPLHRAGRSDDFLTLLNLVDEPLATLPLERVRPGRAVLDEIMESLK